MCSDKLLYFAGLRILHELSQQKAGEQRQNSAEGRQ
jgi:hypothetical protein